MDLIHTGSPQARHALHPCAALWMHPFVVYMPFVCIFRVLCQVARCSERKLPVQNAVLGEAATTMPTLILQRSLEQQEPVWSLPSFLQVVGCIACASTHATSGAGKRSRFCLLRHNYESFYSSRSSSCAAGGAAAPAPVTAYNWDARASCGYAGLTNQGATCYMNSLLQV